MNIIPSRRRFYGCKYKYSFYLSGIVSLNRIQRNLNSDKLLRLCLEVYQKFSQLKSNPDRVLYIPRGLSLQNRDDEESILLCMFMKGFTLHHNVKLRVEGYNTAMYTNDVSILEQFETQLTTFVKRHVSQLFDINDFLTNIKCYSASELAVDGVVLLVNPAMKHWSHRIQLKHHIHMDVVDWLYTNREKLRFSSQFEYEIKNAIKHNSKIYGAKCFYVPDEKTLFLFNMVASSAVAKIQKVQYVGPA